MGGSSGVASRGESEDRNRPQPISLIRLSMSLWTLAESLEMAMLPRAFFCFYGLGLSVTQPTLGTSLETHSFFSLLLFLPPQARLLPPRLFYASLRCGNEPSSTSLWIEVFVSLFFSS